VELIYLASELRKGTGDEKVMSNLLVDYIERVGSQLALDVAEKHGEKGEAHLQQIMSNIESVLVKRLKTRNIDSDVLRNVAEKLNQCLDACMGQLKSQWTLKQKSFTEDDMENPTTTLGVYEGSGKDENELQSIVEKVQNSVSSEPMNQFGFENLDPDKEPQAQETGESRRDIALPKDVLNRDSILYILEKEVARAVRYGTAFSVLMLSIYKITPATPLPPGSIDREKVFNFMMKHCARLFRNTDIIGRLDKEKLLVILPMTAGIESRKAMRRIFKEVHELKYEIEGTHLAVKMAGSVTTFDKDMTPTLKDFVKRAESDIFDMVLRLRNVQSLY
jgi:GGDEF domain-containing protein